MPSTYRFERFVAMHILKAAPIAPTLVSNATLPTVSQGELSAEAIFRSWNARHKN